MASSVDATGDPIPTSSVLMSSSKHIEARCRAANVEFLKCKKKDPNPEKCLDKGREVTRCVFTLYSGETLKHLEKQNELLESARCSMTNELHKLKVEEEMLMRKLYEVMTKNSKKGVSDKDPDDDGDANTRPLVKITSTRK